MKKIILVLFLVIIIVCVRKNETSNEVPENKLENLTENMAIQNVTKNADESEKVILNENSISQNSVSENLKNSNSLEGKTIAFIGDSLIEGYGNDNKGFDYYLAKELPNTSFINYSKSGSTITDNSGDDNIIMINQAKTLTENADIIVFDGGANDIMGYALGFLNNDLKKEIGTIDMASNGLSSGNTVMTDLEEVVIQLKNVHPNAKFCYLQPFLLDVETISHLTEEDALKQEILARRDNFYTEIQKLCTKWNIEYLDVSQEFVGTGTEYRQEDWIHINENGYKRLTPYLLNKLKEM